MKKKCPQGTICFENITIIFILLISGITLYIFYSNIKNTSSPKNDTVVITQDIPISNPIYSSSPYNNTVYENPYVPPLKNAYFEPAIPVNIDTRAINTSYRQIGIATSTNTSDNTILSLMGRPRYPGRSKWQYYIIGNQANSGIKLPLSVNGKSGTNEYGVDELSNGDTVYVEGYNQAFGVTVYDTDTIRYI